ncbi:MAG: PilZ domain-containing protein [Deltaproteobacteria bacterium]|nr:PilZ domain-containing protein [Deltaproteobacteria bacterium]
MVKRNFRIRSHKRAPVNVPVMIIRGGAASEAVMRELSRGGALIESDERLDPAEPVVLGFRLKAIPEVIEVPVEVVYTRSPVEDGRIKKRFGYGVKFGEMSEEMAARIDSYVKTERLFGDLAAALTEARARRERE